MTQEAVTLHKKMKNKRMLRYLIIIAVFMFAFGYALVPIYDVLCDITGLNGKTGGPTMASEAVSIDTSRTVTVQFLTTKNAGLPWIFKPMVKSITLHPGENKRVDFFAENDTNKTMTVQAIPSVTPSLAANYLKKTECFCFNQQTLTAHEQVKMPLIFHLDKDLPKQYHTVTLSYTLFNAEKYKDRGKKS